MAIPCIQVAYILCLALFSVAYCQHNEVSSQHANCTSSPCSCCIDTATCSDNGVCGGQCKDGYFGGKCLNLCPTNCIRCTEHPNVSSTYWGKGYCTECKDGYYSTPDLYQCQSECSAVCQTCHSATECRSCKDGYTLEGPTCRQCKTGCASCISYDNCTRCDDGYYNSGVASYNLNCVACSQGCINQCDKALGTCTCMLEFTGEKCDRCINGRGGGNCNIRCRTRCAKCSTESNCTSCVYGHYLLDATCNRCKINCVQCTALNNCIQCVHGYFGGTCSLPCSTNCVYGNCEHTTGACIGGCTSGYSGDMCCLNGSNCQSCSSVSQCSECVPGKHGNQCDNECPANCEDNICNKDNGVCNKCKYGYQGDKCSIAGAAIGGGVAGGLVFIIIGVVVMFFVYRRRARRMRERQPDDNTGIPTNVNDIQSSENETHENRTSIIDKTRQLQTYQEQQLKHHKKEVEYVAKVARIQHELIEMREHPMSQESEDEASVVTVNSVYETIDPQDVGDPPYATMGTK